MPVTRKFKITSAMMDERINMMGQLITAYHRQMLAKGHITQAEYDAWQTDLHRPITTPNRHEPIPVGTTIPWDDSGQDYVVVALARDGVIVTKTAANQQKDTWRP